MKKQLKIQFADFGGELPAIKDQVIKALGGEYDVILSDDPEILFYGVFGTGIDYLQYPRCIRVFITQEACYPNFNVCDYAIGKFGIDLDGRYCRINNMDFVKDPSDRSLFTDPAMAKRRFCNFLYNNDQLGYGASYYRPEFCKKLAQYQSVDCPGKVLHNMESPKLVARFSQDWHETKRVFLSDYKFTISFENASVKGYFTEKLVDPFLAGSVPIYWGASDITEFFNEKAFINANGKSMEEVIDEVKRLDRDDDLYMDMLMQNPIRDCALIKEDWSKKQADFIRMIAREGTMITNQSTLFFDISTKYVEKYQNTADVKIHNLGRRIKHSFLRR